jgi:hypothetical protein
VKPIVVLSVGILFALSLVFGVEAQTPEPLPTISKNYAPFYVFPANLVCEEIGAVSDGPTWGEITIGVSTLEDLKAYANKVGVYDWIQEWADFIIFANKVSASEQSKRSPTINACVDTATQTITALNVSPTSTVYLEDLVAAYGVPDAVTWGLTNISRTAIWFEEGIAVSVSIYQINTRVITRAYGGVIFIAYFPYQSSEGFEERYPYNFTSKENPVDIDATDDPLLSEAQNPFDFEAMIETITAQPSQTPEPLPPRAKFYPPWDVFPGNLYCEEIGPISEGPTWGEITVGVSTRDDLKAYVRTLGFYDSIQEWDDYIILARTGRLRDEETIPPTINACFDPTTQIITALRVGTHSSVYLDDLVAQYGIPDTVTWGPSNVSRTVFWFEEGVAAYVGIHATDRQAYGEIGYIIYLPYQSKAGFEERYPYRYTTKENLDEVAKIYDPPLSEAQNPFDFEAMIATITAQPSRTPTPTPSVTTPPSAG